MKISAQGLLSVNCPQQKWKGSTPEIMQTAYFAGQNMMLIQQSDDKKSVYELHYLGFQSVGFEGLELAKSQAPEFARTVLKNMAELVVSN